MREGLRSRTRLRNGSGGDGDKENGGVKDVRLGAPAEGLELKVSEKNEDVVIVKEECELDLGVSTSGKGSVDVDLAEDVDNGVCEVDADGVDVVVEKEVKKEEEGLNGTVLASGRVLRSRLKRGDDGKSCFGRNDGVVRGRGRGRGGSVRVAVKREFEEDNDFVPNGYQDKRVGLMMKGGNLKRKRGRPPKVKLEEQVELVVHSPRKRGRPRKENCLPTVPRGGKGKLGIRKGKKRISRGDGANVNVNVNAVDDKSSSRSSEGELENTRLSPVKKNKPAEVLKTEKCGKKQAKQLVREQIMERLSAAGWTVDYRPRNGRPYNDAVYVSPDKKTHWSITLAYNRLKSHYEAGDGEGKVYAPGFKFIPLPEEDVKILTKVINKKRESKAGKAQKGGKGGKMVDGFNIKLKKGKLGSRAGMGKLVKGKMKRKRKQAEEADSELSPNRMTDRVKDHKRRKTQNKKRCAPLVRNADVVTDSEVDGYVPYSGKRTVLAWMIDLGTVLQNGKVHYMLPSTKDALVDGKITGDGIHCGCCDQIITISDFEAHAESKFTDPLKNIHIEGGTSLLQCLLDSWNKQDESERKGFHFVDVAGEDPNDDTCGVCGDGGDLICCDGCPSTFHQSCLDINKFPSGDWHCIYCCCKFCGSVGEISYQGEDTDDFSMSKLLTCDLCEEKYHRSCVEANGDKPDESRDAFFCGKRCQELSESLKMLLGVKHGIEDGFSLTFIWRSDVGSDSSQAEPQIVECNAKLAVALSVMDECFMPYIDHRSGTNLIHSILYNCGSNFKRLNYSGFVTAILERGDEIICAATIRFRGNQIAEMPFIGTRYMYRRKGMCRRLLNGIECVLSSLNIEFLVIPAISELKETWTSVFGFEPLDPTSRKIIKNMSLLVFPHVDLLQKKISKHKLAEENMIPAEVSNLQKNHTEDKVANDCEETGPSGSDLIGSAGITSSNADQINDKTMSVECNGCLPEGSSNNAPDITSSILHHDISQNDVACQVESPENLVVEDNSTANAPDYVSDTCDRAEDTNKHENSSHDCIMQNHDEKPIDLDGQLNNCCDEEKQCLKDVSDTCDRAEDTGTHENSSHDCIMKNHGEKPIDLDGQLNNCCDEERQCLKHVSDSCDRAEDISTHENSTYDCIVQNHNEKPKDLEGQLNNCCNDERERLMDVSDTCHRAEDTGTHENSSLDCIMQNHDEKPIDLDGQSNNCCNEERQCLKDGSVSDEAVFTTNASVQLEPQNITDDLPVNCEKNSAVVSVLNADQAEACSAETPNLKTITNAGDGQPIPVSLGFGEKTVDGANENSKPSAVAEANSLPADEDIENSEPSAVAEANSLPADEDIDPRNDDEVPKNEDWMKGSLELAEPDSQADQTAWSNAPSSCSTPNAASSSTPNTASGVALNCASAGAGSTSCGSTEVMVLSNQAS